jgi:DNA-binding response OmpR family regulator
MIVLPLAGRSTDLSTVLIVEDEMIIALDLEQTLVAAGFATLGPARSVEAALPMIEQRNFDVALVDLELQGALATPVVQRLRDLAIPFAFITGFDREDLPEQFGTELVITKPWDPVDLVETVGRLCSRAHRPSPGPRNRGCNCNDR